MGATLIPVDSSRLVLQLFHVVVSKNTASDVRFHEGTFNYLRITYLYKFYLETNRKLH